MLTFTRSKLNKIGLFICIIVLCAVILSLVFYGVKQFKVGSQLAGNTQVSHLSHALVRQQANLLSVLLTNQANQETLNASLTQFYQQDFVLDATLYATNGTILANAGETTFSAKSLQDNNRTQQIVEPISNDNGMQGYLRVTFDTQYTHTPSVKLDSLFHQLYAQLIIVFLCGGIFASSLHFWHKKTRLNEDAQPLLTRHPLKLKSASQRFYSKRRLLK
ncbi:YtjB family periplasmic protein [Spirabiliibacterium falconis]|uniref:YtjB family periplasmic protein n=1 Tax=Spirabiliibacterium falconis TaxID=572023 RepID=UPI001AAE141F|nr:AhpA/YtjB family protein [Spirabiliibacterium falconis]MBE2893572.1 hemolysin regulation protein AhpA [Spirabiliibacterium falconis]